MEGKNSGMAIASLVLGIIGFFTSWIPIIGWIIVILAIVFGFVALNQIKKNPNLKGKVLAIIGIVLGFIGLIIPILQIIGGLAYFQVLKPNTFLPGR